MSAPCSCCAGAASSKDEGVRLAAPERLVTVGEVARRTGVTRKALRLYEELGLIRPRSRTEAGYRLYDEDALRRLRLVGRAKSLGLSLAETEKFLLAADSCCDGSQPQLVAMVERKLEEAERRLAETVALRDSLRLVLERLGRAGGDHGCEEMLCTCAPSMHA